MILGIDPGVNGALAWLRPDGSLWRVADMPTVSTRVGRTQRQRVNAAALAELVRSTMPATAAVERIGPRPTDSPVTAGYLCAAAGVVEGVLAALGVPMSMVDAREWRRSSEVRVVAGMSYADRKEASRLRALQLWPMSAAEFARKRDADRAEAALIGRWLVRADGGA